MNFRSQAARKKLPVLATVLTVFLSIPLAAQQTDRTEHDCRAAETLSDVATFLNATTVQKQRMWRTGEMFTVPEGTRGTIKKIQYLPSFEHDRRTYLARFRYDGNPNGFYGVWVWAYCFGIEPPETH